MNKIIHGNCLEKLKTIKENSVDSIVTDPPYELGFMGKSWDNSGIAYNIEMWKECFRVLKPGGHLLSFGGTRTYHRMACAIEDAGFEIRDMIEWVYGSGFPKSLNIGKAIDKLQGNERETIGTRISAFGDTENSETNDGRNLWAKPSTKEVKLTKGSSEWEGWGTALKPAHEPICMARKPLAEKTVAENVLKYGTGGINIDESRIPTTDNRDREQKDGPLPNKYGFNNNSMGNRFVELSTLGRFPANLIHDNSEEVRECFPDTGQPCGSVKKTTHIEGIFFGIGQPGTIYTEQDGDNRSASRFFKSIPAHEPICMARKPLSEKTVAENVLKYGTGGINIDESRVATDELKPRSNKQRNEVNIYGGGKGIPQCDLEPSSLGRFPANLIHDNSEEVRECFPDTGQPCGSVKKTTHIEGIFFGIGQPGTIYTEQDGDNRSASRFFKSIPAHEPICMARKPLSEKTIAENVLKYGTGGINIDESRVAGIPPVKPQPQLGIKKAEIYNFATGEGRNGEMSNSTQGRFPANLIHDNSEEVRECFPETKSGKDCFRKNSKNGYFASKTNAMAGTLNTLETEEISYGDQGNASRFFKSIIYTAKAGKSERNKGCESLEEKLAPTMEMRKTAQPRISDNPNYNIGTIIEPPKKQNNHPTVKPIALMEYLIKMITPKGGIVLDPFAGSGTTLVAAKKNGFQYIGIEMIEEYIPIIQCRVDAVKDETKIFDFVNKLFNT